MRRALDLLGAREHDVLIVGGGIYGAAAAWEAAQRGLSVALVEAADFGSGVSWNSLKTIHGGMRHLQRGDFAALRESSRERSALLRIAPELVRPLAFLVPTYGHGIKGPEAFRLGLLVNDWLTAGRNRGLREGWRLPRARVLSRRDVLALLPELPESHLSGGALWHDAQVASSERLLLAFLHAASDAGAALANYAAVRELRLERERVTGAVVEDAERGDRFTVRARFVVNATGPASDQLMRLAGLRRAPVPLLRACNLVLSRPLCERQAVGASHAGRFLFLVPWRGHTLVGTAYWPVATPESGDVERFLSDARAAFPWTRMQASDVALVHRGLVPGGPEGLWTRNQVIDHEREDGLAGFVSLLGVKYTTARAVAEQAIDRIVRRLGRGGPSRTAHMVLSRAAHLPGSPAQQARVAARDEMALHLSDAIRRRLDLGSAGRPCERDVEEVGRAMAEELGWSPSQLRAELDALAALEWAPSRVSNEVR